MEEWKYNKIVVGVDGSKESRQALAWACSEAQRSGVPVIAVSVWTLPLPRKVCAGWTTPALYGVIV